MTIDELRSRHRELLARKKEELALQAEGRGDNMALFMVQEELLEVNAQLRALTPQRRVGTRRVSHSDYLPDRQQYIDWDRENQSLDDEIEDGRQAMLKAVTRSWEILTPKQRQIMELSQAGATQEQIAIRLGVNKSTVSRTLGRAKRSMREEAERSLQEQKLDARHLDMADPATAKVILSAMTPKQAVYLYLYYSEWLSLREISELTKTDHSTIYRTICRALRNIGSVLGYQETVLENMDSLDDLAYQLYSEIQDQDDIVPAEMRPRKPAYKPHEGGVPPRPQELPAGQRPGHQPADMSWFVWASGTAEAKGREGGFWRRCWPAPGSRRPTERLWRGCWRYSAGSRGDTKREGNAGGREYFPAATPRAERTEAYQPHDAGPVVRTEQEHDRHVREG